MEDSRKIIACDGKDYIVWGILVLIGLIGTYVSEMMKVYKYIAWLWIIVICIGWIYSLMVHWRGSEKHELTHLQEK